MEPDVNKNMDLWDTWPDVSAHVKPIDGASYLSCIDATWQAREATRLWGPYGYRWGIRNLAFDLVYDAERVTTVAARGDFFYPVDEEVASFPVAADMPYRWEVGKLEGRLADDIWKKLLTELRSKALLMLGFGSQLALEKGKYKTAHAETPEARAQQVFGKPGDSEPPWKRKPAAPTTDKAAPEKKYPNEPQGAVVEGRISDKQLKRLWALAHKSGADKGVIKQICLELAGTEHEDQMHWKNYQAVCDAIEAFAPSPTPALDEAEADESIPF